MATTVLRQYAEKRVHVLRVSRATWLVVFISLYPGSTGSTTNETTKLPADSDLNKIESAMLAKWPTIKFYNMRGPVDADSGREIAMPIFNIDVVIMRRDYYPLIPEMADYLTQCVNQLLNKPDGKGEIEIEAMPPVDNT